MLREDSPDFVAGLVALAKAQFYNLTLLRVLEKTCPNPPGRLKVNVYTVSYRSAREEISAAHREGIFLQLRRQMPHLTDEALENRLILIAERLRSASDRFSAKNARDPYGFQGRKNDRIKALDELLSDLPKLLAALAETFLCEGSDRSLRVRSRLISYWQDLILVVPPLLISSAWIQPRVTLNDVSGYRNKQEIIDRMARWLCDSTLPVDDDPALDHMCLQHGLDETHMHLMGTTEAEKVWCDALKAPTKVVGKLVKERKSRKESGLRLSIGSGLDRLLRQEDSHLSADLLHARVIQATRLKALLLFASREVGREDLTAELLAPDDFYARESRRRLRNLPHRIPSVVHEAWHLCSILEASRGKNAPKWQLWHYVLLRAQFCRLLVQQADQSGFDQFQYITLSELRETTEQEFAERFRQIERGHQRNVDFLERRFAPKDNPDKLADLLGRILRGYLRFLGEDTLGEARPSSSPVGYGSFSELVKVVRQREAATAESSAKFKACDFNVKRRRRSVPIEPSLRRLRLGLVVHFIKSYDLKEQKRFVTEIHARPQCRHFRMRNTTQCQARILVNLLKQVPDLRHFIRGGDAASNERHAGPEVLAPVFRMLRRAGLQRFTYHAGEDFAHLASGLRSMFEAVHFLDLDAGCRLGHGTAAGLAPDMWWEAIGNSAILPTEDRLDDLIFARHLLRTNGLLPERLNLIDAEIQHLSMKIWADPQITPDLLTEAWLLRHIDPLSWRYRIGDPDQNRRAEAILRANAQREAPLAYRHFLRRHGITAADCSFRPRQMCEEAARGAEQIMISRKSDCLDIETLRVLQRCILQMLNSHRMAIETLPSSNLRISVHESYEQHHALNWMGLGERSLKEPIDVVVGSDDPGIFATSLRMEYAHLMRCLREQTENSGNQHLTIAPIEMICVNAKRFRF